MSKKFSKKMKGMSLIEVLVSFLIVGLGLAMTLSMLQASNRYGTSAEFRANAMREIQSLIDTMRANKLGAKGYLFGTPSYATSYDINNIAKPAVTIKCNTSPCTTKERLAISAQGVALARANADLSSWLSRVNTALPAGQAAVVENGNNAYTATIMWQVADENQRSDTANDRTESLSVNFVL